MCPDDEANLKAIQSALEHHRAGRLSQAEAIYWDVLQTAPDHPDALHLLGMVMHQIGNRDIAVELIKKAIRRNPSASDYCRDLGDVLQLQGKVDEAIVWYHKALALKPDDPDAHFNLGNALHVQGRLDEAVASYRKAVAAKPDYPDAYNNLGAALLRQGKPDEAAESFRKALSFSPHSSDLRFNLGNALRDQGRLDEAIALYREALSLKPDHAAARYNEARILQYQGHRDGAIDGYRNVIAIKPNHADALYYLGAMLHAQGNLDEAVACYRNALAASPVYPEAHNDLGNALMDQGKPGEAVACYRIAIVSRPDFAEAHNNLGNALQAYGKLDEALLSYDNALLHKPGYADALNNRGNVLYELGRFDAAAISYGRALGLKESPEFKANLVQCIRSMNLEEGSAGVRELVTRAISEPWARPADLVTASASLIKLDRDIRDCIERASRAWPTRLSGRELFGPTGLAALAGDPLLCAMLETAPNCDLALERLLTMVRHALLDVATGAAVRDDEPDDGTLHFYCAIAKQCFINEYVFACTDDESERLTALQERLVTALHSEEPVPALWVVAVAAYGPLSSLDSAPALRERSWPVPVAALLMQQIAEPLAERQYRDAMPRLTTVGDPVSRLVQQQYEENPYPRWIKAAPQRMASSIDTDLRRRFPFAPFDPLAKGNDVDILIAGCGTGQESIETARQFGGARVLAIDLSLSSLGYAKRKTHEIGLTNVEYAQGDILELRSTGRTFDIIESVGVLHHIADPMAAWRELHALLRPGGFMLVGLYSERARQTVVAGRKFIAAKGYRSSAADIRRCREQLMAAEDRMQLGPLTSLRDFYTTSECRDLLFHVEEHRFALPQIKDALGQMGLRFVGFLLQPQVINAYRKRFPDDRTATDLDHWNEFEAEFPDTFIGMYAFWVQKPGRS